jgi:hypothetical protein
MGAESRLPVRVRSNDQLGTHKVAPSCDHQRLFSSENKDETFSLIAIVYGPRKDDSEIVITVFK